MEAITSSKAAGRGQLGRREGEAALPCPTEKDEKPNSWLDTASGSLERPGCVVSPLTLNHCDLDIFLFLSLMRLLKTSSSLEVEKNGAESSGFGNRSVPSPQFISGVTLVD